MRVNVYAEEMTDRLELVSKTINGRTYTGLRFYLELPVTVPYAAGSGHGAGYHPPVRGPFMHLGEDDDSAAVTFWGKRDMRPLLRNALELLDDYYSESDKLDELENRGLDAANPT